MSRQPTVICLMLRTFGKSSSAQATGPAPSSAPSCAARTTRSYVELPGRLLCGDDLRSGGEDMSWWWRDVKLTERSRDICAAPDRSSPIPVQASIRQVWFPRPRTHDRQARCTRLCLQTPRKPSVMVQRPVRPNRPARARAQGQSAGAPRRRRYAASAVVLRSAPTLIRRAAWHPCTSRRREPDRTHVTTSALTEKRNPSSL